MKKKAKFFCEYCQTEVKGNARFCSHCGRFFAAVKCPACGKTGSSHAFAHGCPNCGYAVGSEKSNLLDDSSTTTSEKNKSKKTNSKKNIFNNFFLNRNSKQKDYSTKKYSEDSLPLWIYLVAIVFLVVILFLFTKL